MLRKEKFALRPCEVVVDKPQEQYRLECKKALFGSAFVEKRETVRGLYLVVLKANGSVRLTWEKCGATESRWNEILANSDTVAITGWTERATGRRFWLVNRELFSEIENLTAAEVWALVNQKKRAKERKLKKAFAATKLGENPDEGREAISEDVRIFVWRRDGGKCTKCGSDQGLEFDHIIPLAMGGSNTARNIQLLCEDCNRSKGPNLI